MTKLAALAVSLSTVLAVGCMDIEQTLALEKNLSGQASLAMKFDFEPVAGLMVGMQRALAGKPGTPTPAELAQARQELLASGKTTTSGDFEKGKKEFESMLPQGVTLLDASFKEDGLKVAANFRFGFDHVAKLSQIKFPKGGAIKPGPGPSASSSMEAPFETLQLVDDGKTLLLSSAAENPLGDQQAQMGQMPLDPAMKKQMEEMLKGLRIAVKITAPFEILEHNAHRREGATLVWDYNLQTLEKLTPAQTNQGIRVRYRK